MIYLPLLIKIIMSSHNNLHKIRKLTNTIDLKGRYSTLDNHNPQQKVKLPTLNAINKSVKYGDVSFTFSRDLSKLRKEPQSQDLLAEELAHSSMLTVRRRYDSINREKGNQQSKIKDLEAEKIKYQIQKGKYEADRAAGQTKMNNLEEQLRRIKHALAESQMERRVMAHMVARLKTDKVVFDKRKYDKQLEYNLMTRHKEMLSQDATKLKEQNNRIKKVYTKLVNHISAEQNEREIHVGSMQYMVGNKIDAFAGCREKKEEMREIAEITLSEKDTKQKNWYKVYLCHKFMERMMRDKMDREMTKFNAVQMAFKNVKTATGVSTTQSLVSKFLKKEQEYGIMLGKIANSQKRIVELKGESDILNKQHNKLKSEQESLSISKRQDFDLSYEEKTFNQVSQRSSSDYLLEETIKLWLFKNIKKIRVFGGEMEKVDMGGGKKIVIDKFKSYLERLDKEIQKIGVIEEKIQGEDQEDMKIVVSGSNIRISLNPDEKPRQNQKHVHRELHHQLVQQRPESNGTNNQDEVIDEMREKMIRQNEKFMKEAHRRQEERKKLKIEAQPKKKQVTFQRPRNEGGQIQN